jgi:nucleotide-binding universal stress UspA family protein
MTGKRQNPHFRKLLVGYDGRRGRSMIARMMLGSVSERALRYAHCPVMVVH